METDIFKHIKIIIYKVYVCKKDKATHFPRDFPNIYLIRIFSAISLNYNTGIK
jgi:hypothetical protein